ncbi:MAG TPA: hypothetical protein DF296_07945 [Candidatus Margulisbacteria bacterium]|nr:hypothetical protein [Candidatus Margulisiibacteriota bacterium]
MKTKVIILSIILPMVVTISQYIGTENYYHLEFGSNTSSIGVAYAYPPSVGILTKSKNCLACHPSNGQWSDESKNIIDMLEADTKKSLKQSDGSFLIEVKRNQAKTVLTVIGRTKEDLTEPPYRNAWIYIDPKTIETSALSKFAPGWECNLQMACRVIGDKLENYDGAEITSLPMTIRPTDSAQDSELQLQVMLTKGESVKGNAKQGMMGNYFEKKVKLKVIE